MKSSNENGLGLYKPYTGIYDVKTPFSSWERIEAQKEDNLDKLLNKYKLNKENNMKLKSPISSRIRKISEKLVSDLFMPVWVEIGVYEEPEKLAGILTAVGNRVKVTRNVLLSDSRDEPKVREFINSKGIKEKYPLEKVWQVNQ
jgi:hypothetical protein